MNLRALIPWLLAGALIASVFVNLVSYSQLSDLRSVAEMPVPPRTEERLNVHFASGANQGRCPTLDRLGLSEEQRDLIRKCTLTSLSRRTEMALEVEQVAANLDRLLAGDSFDPAEVLRLAERITELRSRQYKAWIGSILVVRDALTPEQLKLLRDGEAR